MKARWLRRLLIMAVILVPAFTVARVTTYPAQRGAIGALAAADYGLKWCLNWKAVGVCIWLKCYGYVCSPKYSVKVRNYVPDIFTNVHTEASGIGNTEDRGETRRRRDQIIYRNADVVGHPMSAASIIGYLGISSKYICLPRTIPYFTYLDSIADRQVWRSLVPIESLYIPSLVPGLREIGDWGSVYPRIGFVVQTDEVKAAAIVSQRVGDIVTRKWQPHVYIPLDTYKLSSGEMLYFPPKPLKEGDRKTGIWQQFWPVVDDKCYVFGVDDAYYKLSWSDKGYDNNAYGRRSDDGTYGWNLWRPYECCKEKGIFLASVGGWFHKPEK